MPTSASTRRTPAPIEDSPRSLTRPSWPERRAWVPPQSSRAQSPTETTRTWSPYFSPNSAIAPAALACSWLMTSACTSRSAASTSLTRASTSREDDSRDGAGGREVEPEPPGRVLRARLGRGLAQRLAERLVHQVGRRVRAADRAAAVDVDRRRRPRRRRVTSPRDDPGPVHDQARDRRLDVVDLDPRRRRRPRSRPGRRAGRRPRRRTACGRARPRRRRPRAAAGADAPSTSRPRTDASRDDLVVAGELDRSAGVAASPGRRTVSAWPVFGPCVGLGPLALLVHQPAEAGLVDARPCSAAISRVRSIGKP